MGDTHRRLASLHPASAAVNPHGAHHEAAHRVVAGGHDHAGVNGAVSRTMGPATSSSSAPDVEPVKLAVLAKDSITGQGALAYLATRTEVRLLPMQQYKDVEVFLVIVDHVDQETLDMMQRAADTTATRDARFVMVGDGLRDRHLFQAITHGLVSVLPRKEADFDRIVKAVCAIRDDQLEIPDLAISWIVQQLRAVHQEVLAPRSLTLSGLEVREIQVLKLLSQGLDTAEIAVQLNYSERTVKSIIQTVLRRQNLRNRAHAVAFALRSGWIA